MIGQLKQDSQYRLSSQTRRPKRVQNLALLTRRNLWEVLLFLLVSLGAYACLDSNLFLQAPENLRQLLGTPPPAFLIDLALATYLVSALILSLTRIAKGTRPAQNWSQLGYRCIFYLFYSFSGSLAAHFSLVFGIGIFLYGLEQAGIWIYSSKFAGQDELCGEG